MLKGIAPLLQLFGLICYLFALLIIRACTCVRISGGVHLHFCIFWSIDPTFFVGNMDALLFGQTEGGAQMDVAAPLGDGIGEDAVGMPLVVLRREVAEAMEGVATCFATVGGDGKGELYIFGIAGGDIGVCFFDCRTKAAQRLNFIHNGNELMG